MRFTLGLAVFSGMLGVTFFGVFFTPVFYSVIRWLTSKKPGPETAAENYKGTDIQKEKPD
jgi:hypothetical protein